MEKIGTGVLHVACADESQDKEFLTMRTLLAIALTGTMLQLTTEAWAQNDAKDVYTSKCAVCHGADGAAKSVMGKKLKIEDVRVLVSKHSADEMIGVVEKGKAPSMKAYGKDLTKEQIKGVVDYYRGLAKQ